MHRELHFKFLHRLPELILLILVLLSDCAYKCFIFSAQCCLIILMLLLQYPYHVRVVYAHPLYQVLVMPLSPRLALQRVLNLLLQSAVVTIQRLYTFLCTFILASKFLNEFSLGTSNMLLLSYVISKLFILRLYLF